MGLRRRTAANAGRHPASTAGVRSQELSRARRRQSASHTLGLSPPRNLDRQVTLWNASLDARTAALDPLERTLNETAKPIYDLPDSLPEWIEPWWREKEHRGLLRVFALAATNDGHEFDLQMLVARDGVRVVWKLGSLESWD